MEVVFECPKCDNEIKFIGVGEEVECSECHCVFRLDIVLVSDPED